MEEPVDWVRVKAVEVLDVLEKYWREAFAGDIPSLFDEEMEGLHARSTAKFEAGLEPSPQGEVTPRGQENRLPCLVLLVEKGGDLPHLAHVLWIPGVVSPVPLCHAAKGLVVDGIHWLEDGGKTTGEVAALQGFWEEGEVRQDAEAAKALPKEGDLLSTAELLSDDLAVLDDRVGAEMSQICSLVLGGAAEALNGLRGERRGQSRAPLVKE
mmetsp:Transcript_23990/g.70368  ORF Transcript_23990/g.70368 Transcript_23990/m.70368 type:complete len:211 (-) Transcript_23990:405-1037(-)